MPAFIKNAGQITLLSNMKNAPVVEPRRTRWGRDSRNGYEELDHRSLYVREISIIIGKSMSIIADGIPIL